MSSPTLIPVYPTPIYSDVCLDQPQLAYLRTVCEGAQFQRSAPSMGQANELTHIRINQFEQQDLTVCRTAIHAALTDYMNQTGFAMRPYQLHGWFTRNSPGDYLQLHHHNDIDVAGTVYIQTAPDCGDFYFESPVTVAPHSMVFAHLHNRIYITPEEGQIVLFPGWIQHGVLRNNSTVTRLGLSFNISFER